MTPCHGILWHHDDLILWLYGEHIYVWALRSWNKTSRCLTNPSTENTAFLCLHFVLQSIILFLLDSIFESKTKSCEWFLFSDCLASCMRSLWADSWTSNFPAWGMRHHMNFVHTEVLTLAQFIVFQLFSLIQLFCPVGAKATDHRQLGQRYRSMGSLSGFNAVFFLSQL